MIAVDTDIPVCTHNKDAPFHEAAFRRMEELAEGSASWAIPSPCLHEFLTSPAPAWSVVGGTIV